jgi:hypothetical protein
MELARWAGQHTLWVQQHMNTFRDQMNNITQGVDTQASAGTVIISKAITHITGANTISTLTPPSDFGGVAWLIADGAFSITTGGNIALARGPYTVGQAVKLIFDPTTTTWYPE